MFIHVYKKYSFAKCKSVWRNNLILNQPYEKVNFLSRLIIFVIIRDQVYPSISRIEVIEERKLTKITPSYEKIKLIFNSKSYFKPFLSVFFSCIIFKLIFFIKIYRFGIIRNIRNVMLFMLWYDNELIIILVYYRK